MSPRCCVISPVRNEAAFLKKTIDSMVRQSLRPMLWVIVDDGSTDNTKQLAENAAGAHSWIKVLARPDRGFRKSGSGVMEAFYAGLSIVGDREWDILVKLDGDLEFDSEAFATICRALETDSRLGIAGGDIYHFQSGERVIESKDDPAFHVRGATKFYKRSCWKEMDGIPAVTGWDTLDEVKANMLNWKSARIAEAQFLHLRPTGAADGGWKNAFKNGRGSYISGYHPLYMIAKSVRRLMSPPIFVQSAGLLAGFFSAYCCKVAQINDRSLIRYLRKQQIRRLLGLPSVWT